MISTQSQQKTTWFLCRWLVGSITRTGLLQPHLRSLRVGLQTLAIGQLGGDGAQHLGTGFAHLDEAAAFLEVVHAQRRREACRAAGG